MRDASALPNEKASRAGALLQIHVRRRHQFGKRRIFAPSTPSFSSMFS
jgi:hypothetical protein